MNETECRTGAQGGAHAGGKWFSAQELRATGRRVTDGLLRGDVGICPACGASRLGTTDGPGSLHFAPGSECLHCGHVEETGGGPNMDMAEQSGPGRRPPVNRGVEDARAILDAEEGNGEAVAPLDEEQDPSVP